MLWQTCSLISGSIALAALLPYQLPTWNSQDIGIYTTEQSFPKVLAHVLTDGYTIMVDTTTNPKYPGPTSIALVVTLSGPKGLNLNIIVSCTKSALTLIFEYYGSHVINCRAIQRLSLSHTGKRCTCNTSIITANYFLVTDIIHRCMIKYTI